MEYEDLIYRERPVSPKHHMEVAHRAKQFAPFAALTGLEQSVRKKEIVYVPRTELSEEAKTEIDRSLRKLQRLLQEGNKPDVAIMYFDNRKGEKQEGLIRSVRGRAEFLDPTLYLRVEEAEIRVKDILNIELEMSENSEYK